MTLKQLLLADLARHWRASGSATTPDRTMQIVRSLANHKFLPVVLFRVARSLQGGPLRPVALLLSLVNQVLFGVEIALQSEIGPGLYFPHTGGIVLGADRIGANATIYHGVTLGAAELDVANTPGLRPVLGDGVVVAAGAKVLGGVEIGDRAIVGANAVVVKDVMANEIVGGIPASRISERKPEDSW